MRKRLLAIALTVVLAVGGEYVTTKPVTVAAADDYSLAWSDEFNGTSLDKNVWSFDIGNGNWGWGNGEIEYYTNREDNVKVSDGNLQIIAKKENYGGKQYTSGRIKTSKTKYFTYGKMEARLKVENGNQSGVWPAFWMLGENSVTADPTDNKIHGWPYCGEIDIMEHANDRNFVGGCLHWNTDGLNGAYKHRAYGSGDAGKDFTFADNTNNGINGWHTYGLIWDENHMEWTVDGISYFSQKLTDNNKYCFTKDFFFIFNLALGGTDSPYTGQQTVPANYQTAIMYVDYVRVYKPTSEVGTTQTPTQKPTTKPSTNQQPTSVSYETVDAVEGCSNNFLGYYGTGWDGAEGTSANTTNRGIDMNISKLGNSVWGIQASLSDLNYVVGSTNTYTYKCTLNSDVTKNVRVKVVGEDSEYDIFSMEDVTVEAGIPYYYEKQVTIPESYTGRLDLYFGLGKNDDNLENTSALNINISDVSFVTEKKNITILPTTAAPTKAPTTKNNTTTAKVVKPSKTKVSKLKSTKKKSIKITLSKVKKIDGYQIKYSRYKSFKKAKTKNTYYRTNTIKKLKSKKTYYFKARTFYLNDDGKKVYSSYCKAKKIKCK